MDLLQAMKNRHSVRSYTDRPIEGSTKESLLSFIRQCNEESGLHMQLVLNEPNAFDGLMAHYGKFSGVRNYIAVIGKKERIWRKSAAITVKRLFFTPRPWALIPAGSL